MKHIRNAVGIIFCASVIMILVIYVENGIILNERTIQPVPGIKLDQWLRAFSDWSQLIVSISALSGLVWYMVGQWLMKHDRYTKFSRRPIWFLLLVPSVASVVVAALYMPSATAGAWLPHVLGMINGIGTFYLGTVFFSPSSLKYTPPFASVLRRGW